MRKFTRLVLASGLVAACGGGGAEDESMVTFTHPLLVAENAYGGPPPEGAESVSAEEFVARVESGQYTLLTEAGRQAAGDRARQEAEDDRARVLIEYADEPELLPRLQRDIDPTDPDVRELADGSVQVRGVRADPQRGTTDLWFQLDGPRWSDRELVQARDEFETRATQAEVYQHLYDALDDKYRTAANLPSPDSVTSEDYDFFLAMNQAIAADWKQFTPVPTPQPPPADYPNSWRGEIGSGAHFGTALGGDREGPEGLPTGLWADIDFPLKWYATRVRSQGSRGNSLFFAITGAVEARYAARNGVWLNLSEQFLVYSAYRTWKHTNFGEGAWPTETFLSLRAGGFVFPYEHAWDYNKSRSRVIHDATRTYSLSCLGYAGRFCSDTNHQAPMLCIRVDPPVGGPYIMCASRRVDEVAPATGVRLARAPLVGDFRSRTVNHSWAKAMLAFGYPIVYYFDMPRRTFLTPGGLLPFDPTDRIVGSRAVLILGYVSNDDLPAGVPPGSGGGYYIMKNSWGTDFGDAGYCYAPDDWVARYMISMRAVVRVANS